MAEVRQEQPAGASPAIVHGVIGGIIAGIVFAISEMVMAALTGMPAVAPLQMIGAIVLGPATLEAAATAGTLAVGLIVHLVLSAIYGVILALIVLAAPALRASIGTLTIVGAVYGLLLWLVNFYVIAPAAFPWFAMADPVVQFIAHVVFYGAVLGYYLGTRFAQPSRAL